MILTILLAILIPLAVILAISLLFFMYIFYQNRKLKTLLRMARENINENRDNSLAATLKRISIISESNPSMASLYEEANIVFTDFFNNSTIGKKHIASLKVEIQKIRFSYKESYLLYKKIESLYPLLDRIESQFKILSDQVISQDTMTRNEFTFYQTNLRMAVNVYREKRILLDKISPQIDKLTKRIKGLEKDFEVAINKADSVEATKITGKYISNAMKFINVINEGPAINTHLRTQIPNAVKNLTELYKQKKNEGKLSIPLKHIEFQKSIKEISKKFKKAKSSFNELDIESTKQKIKEILKGFKTIESQINLEVRSRNIFVKIYEPAIKSIKTTLTNWISLKEQFKTVLATGKKVDNELIEKYQVLRSNIKLLDSNALEFRDVMKDSVIPFSSKIQRAKFISLSVKKTIELLNEFIGDLWNLNYNEAAIKHKFKKSEIVIHDLISNTKKENIKFSDSETKELEIILEQKSVIAKGLEGEINTELKDKVEKLSNRVINFYSLIMGNTQIAIHVKNLIKEFSNRRSLDAKINLGFQAAERKFIEGEYAASLNIAIETIGESNK